MDKVSYGTMTISEFNQLQINTYLQSMNETFNIYVINVNDNSL